MEPAVRCEERGIKRSLAGQRAVERAAVLKLQCCGVRLEGSAATTAARRSGCGCDRSRGETPQQTRQRLHFRVAEIELRHAFVEPAVVHERGQLVVGMRGDEGNDSGSAIGAVGVAAVADGAMRRERPGGARRGLSHQRQRCE